MVKRRTTVSASIDIELLEALEDMSRETGQSISSLIRSAVRDFVKKNLELIDTSVCKT